MSFQKMRFAFSLLVEHDPWGLSVVIKQASRHAAPYYFWTFYVWTGLRLRQVQGTLVDLLHFGNYATGKQFWARDTESG